jgi:16S rRNA C967 or C1407 C5-methylase (RsmB/RsmF family)
MDWAVQQLGLIIQVIDCYGTAGLTEIDGKPLDSTVARCRRVWPDQTQGFFVAKLKQPGGSQ